MVENLKCYFKLTDDKHNDVLALIVSVNTALAHDLGLPNHLVLAMCIEDFSSYLKSGDGKFSTSNSVESLHKYSEELQATIRMCMSAKAY